MRIVRQINLTLSTLVQNLRINLQRTIALFLVAVLAANICVPPMTALAATLSDSSSAASTGRKSAVDTHAKASDPRFTTDEQTFSAPSAMPTKISSTPAAVDAEPQAGSILSLITGKSQQPGEAPQLGVDPQKIKPHELPDRRTASSDQTVNADGSITQRNYFEPKYFQQDNAWTPIDTSLEEDITPDDPTNPIGMLWDNMQTWLAEPQNFIEKANSWQVRFSATGFNQGMVRIKQGSEQIGFVPVNANDVKPDVTTDDNGNEVVRYADVWNGVDLESRVGTDSVKENIVLKNKSAATSIAFTVVGASLTKQAADAKQKTPAYYQITGAFNDTFGIAAPNLILNNFGLVSDSGVLNQTFNSGVLTTSVDSSYLQKLQDSAFPAVIDPTTFTSNFGTRDGGGNYVSLKSDGYVCPSTTCNIYAGSLYDSNNVLRYWRSAFYAKYDQFKNGNNTLISASLHLLQRTNAGYWTGTTSTHTFSVGRATCTNSYSCLSGGAFNASGSLATSGNIDVTSIYADRISHNDFGMWLMLGGEDGTTSSFKEFDPGTNATNGSYVSFTYGGPPTAPSFTSPSTDNQVFVTTQPSFLVNKVDNPNSTTVPLQYEILVSTGTAANGALMTSGKMDSRQWTIPDSILQDGATYYVQARTYDPVTSAYSGWSTSIPFGVDLRTGKDKTQTYDVRYARASIG